MCFFIYAFLIGGYHLCKKMFGDKTSPFILNTIFCTVAFLLSCIYIVDAMQVDFNYLWLLSLKGMIIGITWFIYVVVIRHLDISIVSIICSMSMVIVFGIGIVFLNETVTLWQTIGTFIVLCGVLVSCIVKKNTEKNVKIKYILLTILFTVFSAIASIIDKVLMSHVSSGQAMFWYLLFATVFLWIISICLILAKKMPKVKIADWKNKWIYISAILLVVADSIMYIGLADPNSKITLFSSISKLKFVFTAVGGFILFKEKITFQKVISMSLILIGVLIVSFV